MVILSVFPAELHIVVWKIQTLKFPVKPDRSICFNPSWSCVLMRTMLVLWLRMASNHLPRHFVGLSMMDGMSSPWTWRLNRLVTVPRLMTRLLDFLGLNFILAQVGTSSNAFSTHLACIRVWVVTVRTSMKPLFVENRMEKKSQNVNSWLRWNNLANTC